MFRPPSCSLPPAQNYIVLLFVLEILLNRFLLAPRLWNGQVVLPVLLYSIHPSIRPSDGSTAQIGPWPPPLRFLNHTELDTRSRTPLDEWSHRRRRLCLHRTTQHINTRDKHPCPDRDSNPRSQQPSAPQTFALDRAAAGVGVTLLLRP
jgi:hypothetical protein